MKKLRWGILSTARIAITKVIPAIQRSRHGHVVAIASRDPDKACRVATTQKVPNHYGSYEALLKDPRVDAVYIPLPNNLHVPWSMCALRAGKHVLCEKPLGLSHNDVQPLEAMAASYPQLTIAEGFMYRHHPQWHQVFHLIRGGSIGRVRSVDVHFTYRNLDPENIRNRPPMGGGALMDIGCYGISVSKWIFDEEPARIQSTMHRDPKFGTDMLTCIILAFPSGSSTITCSTQLQRHQQVTILGTRGCLTVPVPFNVRPDEETLIHCRSGSVAFTITTDPADQFARQSDHFAQAVRHNKQLLTTLSESCANMRVLDACATHASTMPAQAPAAR
ncbi:MAG: Gfo/Idh/MocA family oxidoreductase [Bacteroidota bacterium]|nr:Gfo/Idh/MocA family oxidoreductase [Bacteroidota bacterium]MDE2957618.1 Gfo/Idh/MocA family oxidoreductase [Bacteroidota bacterium]